MDRQTRRANFKKLQEPASRKLRSTRSNKAATLSDFFNTPEDISNEQQEQLPSDKDEPEAKKTREMREISPPAVSKPKKAPKLKTTATQQRRGRGGSRGRSKQQPSISDFLRNEQLFAEVTAQHCIADNFSPNDIEMALALSKSEAEKYGRLRLEDTTQEEQEEVVDLLDAQDDQSTENVRRKLQKYGFRTAAKADYNMLTFASLPGGKRGKRCKWANKFTPLTLRNPVEQLKKLDAKIAALMAQQVRTKLPAAEDQIPFELISSVLQRLKATGEYRITHEPSEESLANLSAYYVQDLFEVSRTPAHHLLKNWAAIQGRDLSPKRPSKESLRRKQQLEQVYSELEAHFGATAEKEELDELELLLADNLIQDNSQTTVDKCVKDAIEDKNKEQISLSINSSPLKEPPDKRQRIMQDFSIDKENMQPSTSSKLSLPTQSTRCTSPDLFADSDEDEHDIEMPSACSKEMQNFSLKVYKDISTTEINCYEIYSSDEVKIVPDAKLERTSIELEEGFIDLTQEEDSPERVLNTTSSPSLFEQQIFAPSPTMDSEEEADALANDSSVQAADCEISDELYAKYANKTTRDFDISSATESKPDDNSFNLSSTSATKSLSTISFPVATNSNSCKDLSFSFTQLDSTKQTFQRSFSLTQSPRESLQWKHSFKSPASTFTSPFSQSVEKPVSTFTSPFSQSDASIDLTQDSCEDEDNEGILLSDDEINYSIWKADETCRDLADESSSGNESTCNASLSKRKTVPYFRTTEDLDAFLAASSAASIKSCNSRSPNKSALSKERAEFGILDAAISQPFTLSQPASPTKAADTSQLPIDWAEASFLETPPEAPVKRYSSSCSHKFKDLLRHISEPAKPIEDAEDDEIDEFDRLVFQHSKDTTVDTMPSGLDRLLMGEINVDSLPEPVAVPVSPAKVTDVSEKLELNGQVYNVSICQTPKPDFVHLSEAELLQQLYNYGIKPLKRKQAVKLLEYIYNQTHPIMLPPQEQPQSDRLLHSRSKSTPVNGSTNKSHVPLLHNPSADCLTPTEAPPNLNHKFRDAPGTELLRFSQAVPPALCDDFECYVLQTNVSKKTPQPLLPLHIAWHNLLCANPRLHESVLMFEPIDLQEIYLYLKQLGHRYDPKELKCFFDRRCIIFRYELAPPAKPAQRHIRKPKSKKPGLKS
ncbi:structure-specific endonuclease subunit SLX4 isoform X2 [Drosophila grimshawi]|uniref:structure-specific endonuclease subunit SLX4 isoform X2 n=1 Tax=Drosophila grimshawi TaxID=7222 RepID=UPI000C8704EA|nr:structure-specific endonuclease subunit SLX4 isoform X2 [Drosophila grimshawi]